MHDGEMMKLARAYIKIQQYTRRWPPMEALYKGTIFPELYSPYEPPRRSEPIRGQVRASRRGG